MSYTSIISRTIPENSPVYFSLVLFESTLLCRADGEYDPQEDEDDVDEMELIRRDIELINRDIFFSGPGKEG